MIPSYPLRFSQAFRETFRIFGKSFLRLLVFLVVLFIPIEYFLATSAGNVAEDSATLLRSKGIIGDSSARTIQRILSIAVHHPDVLNAASQNVSADIKLEYDSLTLRLKTEAGEARTSSFFVERASELAGSFAGLVIAMFVTLFAVGLLITITGELAVRGFEERRLDTKQIIAAGFRHLLKVLALFGLFLLYSIATNLITDTALRISNTLGGFFNLLFSGLSLFLLLRFCVAFPSAISEGLGPIKSLLRSWQLTERHFLRIFGWFLILTLILALTTLLCSIPLFIIASGGIIDAGDKILHTPSLSIIQLTREIVELCKLVFYIYSVPSLFNNILFVIFATVTYYDLRTRMEGPLEYEQAIP